MSKGTAPTEGPGTGARGTLKKNFENLLTTHRPPAIILLKGEPNPTNGERVDTMTKMTYVAALSFVLENCTDLPAEVAEKLTALKAQTEKRNSADRKPTKAQIANEALKARVLEVLTAEPATVTEIMARDEELTALSNQKVSALVNALADEGKAVKTVEKRKSYFTRA